MPLETIQVVIGAASANPQTKSIQINVDPNTGSGSGTVSFTGANGGIDTITANATIAGAARASNPAYVAWQATNGILAVGGNVTIDSYANTGGAGSWPGLQAHTGGPKTSNTVVFNQVRNGTPIPGFVSPDGKSGAFTVFPPIAVQTSSSGAWASNQVISPTNGGFVIDSRGNFVVSQAGIQTIYMLVDDAWALYIGGGATRSQGTLVSGSPAAPATGPLTNFPLIGTRNTAATSSTNQLYDYVYVNFPKPGVYPFETWWVNSHQSNQYMVMSYSAGSAQVPTGSNNSGGTFLGGVLKPVALQSAPSTTIPAGNLQLSVANGSLHVTGDSVTLNVSVNGIHYTTKPYIPLLEGVAGKLFIYNDPSNPAFNYPTFNGQPVDKAAAITQQAITLSGNNGSWQGRLSAIYDGSNFALSYNGSTFDSHVDATQLSVVDDDVSWFDSTTKNFDLFTQSSSGGGDVVAIEVDYMIMPAVSSISPSSVTADGGSHIFTVSLAKPVSPQQQGKNNTGNTISAGASMSGGASVTNVTANVDANGWLIGWNVTATIPSSTANGSITLSMTVSGTLTRLSGTTFVTGSVTYITGAVGTFSTIGQQFIAPSPSAFAKSPNTTSVSGSITLTATVSSHDNGAISLVFYRQIHGTSTRTSLGAASVVTKFTSGGLFYTSFTLTVTSTFLWGTSIDLGYVATDAASGLSLTWFNSTVYTNANAAPGGGGGGGCPALEMFVSDYDRVGELSEGSSLSCLARDPQFYVNFSRLPLSEVQLHDVKWLSHSEEPCYHLTAENGASVIISASTPVPTRETACGIIDGSEESELVIYANDVRAGMHVLTDIGNGPEWSMLEETVLIGVRSVARLYVGGRNFAAGVEPGKYIFTHNTGGTVK